MSERWGMKTLATAFCLFASAAAAQSLDGVVQLDVLPGWRAADGTHMAGLQITLAPGWKTYWRAPGDAGIPPQIDFSGSDNVASARFMWPVPEVFDQGGMRSIGYHDSVVVPVELTPDATGNITLSGMLDIGVCEEICVPARLPFSIELPAEGKRDPQIVAALVNRPLSADEGNVTAATCAIAPSDDGLTVTATLTMPTAGAVEHVVVEASDPLVWVSEPDVRRSGGQLTATVDMVHVTGGSFALDRSGVRVTVLGSDHAVDVRGCSAG